MTNKSSRLDSLFLAALDIESVEQRAAFLESACGHDSELRKQVERLLQSHQEAGSFLQHPPPEYEATIVTEASNTDRAGALEAGMAASFSEDQAVVIGHAGHSVLKRLRQSMDLPGVALRNSVEDGHDPIVRPKSAEMPDRGSDSRYQLQGEIARGGMGAILKGRDTDLGRELAIKVLLDAHKDKPEVVQRFIEEAQIGGQLQHPGIAPVYELGQFADRRPFFSMKLVKGETLSKLLAERKDATDERGKFLAIFQQICQTMAYAHSRGVIHRDLKPANIMVGAFGEVQVMDWGLAKVLPSGGVADEKKSQSQQQGQSIIQTLRGAAGSDPTGTFGTVGSHTQVGSVMGTPAYMPPEQALGEIDHLDERADVFGLGAILCEILTGKPPYVGDDGTQVFRLASRGKLKDCFLRLDACGADAELIALARHCLELEPADRPRDAGALADRVTDYLESVQTKLRETELERATQAARADAEAAQANAERQRAQEERRRRRTSLALAASVLLLVGVGSGGWLYLLNQKADRQTAEADAQRSHARAMQALAEQRDEQRKVAELAEQNAIAQKNRADLAAEVTQRNLYYAQMHLAQQAWRDHRGIGNMQSLLANWVPDDELPSRRQWEWFYINSLPYQNLRTLPKQGIHADKCSVAWHLSSNRLAEGSADGMIRIWDVAREQITLIIQGPQQALPYWERTWFAWSPDGAQLAACGGDGTVHVWETVSGTERLSAKTHSCPGVSVDFDSTGMQLAVCGEDGSIKIVDTQTGEISPGVVHPGSVTAAAWSFDHRKVAMGHFDGTVTDSDIQLGAEINTIPAHSSSIYCLAWSPDGRRLVTASSEQFYAQIWDLDSRQPVSEPLRHSHAILSMAWSADGHKLATGGFDQTVKIWKTDKGQEAATLRGQFASVYSIVWGPEDRFVASGGEDGGVKIWTSLLDQESVIIPGTIRATAATWSPDGKRLAVGSDDGLIRILDPARSDTLVSLKLPVNRQQYFRQFGLIRMLAWSPDGTYLASAGTDGRVDAWNVASGENVVLPAAEGGLAWCVAWSPDGNDLAAGFEDGTVQIYEGIKQSPSSRVFQAHSQRVFTLAWSPKGDRLATGSYLDNDLRVWDPEQGKQVMVMDNRGNVMGLAWNPDGRQLACSSGAKYVKTWDAATGQELQTMQGHHDYVNAVVWSPDGSRLASAGFDNSVRIWDPATGTEACVLRGSNGFFHDVSWNPDGARLAAACSDGNVWIWDATRGFERDTTPRALPFIDRAVAAGTARGDDLRWYAESYIRAGRIKEALDIVAKDSAALALAVQDPRVKGSGKLIGSATANTITEFKRQFVANPNAGNATQLANLLLAREERKGWSVLRPVEMQSKGGATFTPQEDGSILVSGPNVSADVYTISAESEVQTVQAICLDALPDGSHPRNGPGRHPSGNFQLAKFRVFGPEADDPTEPAPVTIRKAIASFAFMAHDADPAGTIDETSNQVWHVWSRSGQPHCIYYELASPLRLNPGDRLTIVLQHNEFSQGINLGRFRLTVSDDLAAIQREEQHLAVTHLTNPWMKLAAAYQIVGDEPALAWLLEHHPEAVAGLGDLKAAEKNWDQALAYYNRAITPQTTDAALLSRRVAVYLATEQWDLAKADWQRAVALDPDLTQAAFDQFQRAQRWNEALEFGQKLLDSNPDNSLHWLQLAPVIVLTGDDESYRDFCRQYALQFKNSADEAERVIKGCLLKPGFIDLEMLPSEALAKCLDEETAPDWVRPWAWGSRAILAYRSGDAESAVSYVANAEALKPPPNANLLNLAILALAEHQLGHTEQSRLSFHKLSRLAAQYRDNSRFLDHDLLIAEILLKEADAKINGSKQTPPAAEPDAKSPNDKKSR